MIVLELTKAVGKAMQSLGIEKQEVTLEHPAELSHGDYSTNVALVCAKSLKQKPREAAEQIVRYIELQKIPDVEKVEVAGPGFINFHLSKEFFIEAVKGIDTDFGRNKNLTGKKVMVEYTDPNPFKEFHIGHLMSNAIGESISRLIEFQGAEVKRACYQGDVGLHVAKALWGALQESANVRLPGIGTGVFWGQAYVLGSEKYETDPHAKKEIEEVNKKVYDRSDETINKLYDQGREVSLLIFDTIYKRLGTTFDYSFFESETGAFGKKIVEEFLGKGVFEKSDGAIIFPGEKHGLHTRVFINSQGLPTYEAKELGLAKIKYGAYPYDQSIVITANEINEYFKVLLCALHLIFPELAKKTKHLSHGMLRLPSGKMSSRKGNVITGEGLITQVEKLVQERLKERDMPESEKEKVAEMVAIGAIKYSILRQAIGGDIIFDFEKSISFEGDSGPYLQYACVRAQSVLEKAKAEQIQSWDGKKIGLWETTTLEKLLYRFPEVVRRAGSEYEPHHIVTYLTELAGVFNSWYAGGKIVDASNQTSPYKVALTQSFTIVMKNGLWLLGIAVPEWM